MPTGSSADYRWGFMLLGLQWALDQHRAALRRVAWPRHKVSLSRRDLCPSPPKPAELLPSMQAPGCSLSATTRSKRRLEKIIPDALEFVRALRGFVRQCAGINDALFGVTIEGAPEEKIDVQVWLSAFGVSQDQIEKFEIEWPPHLQDMLT